VRFIAFPFIALTLLFSPGHAVAEEFYVGIDAGKLSFEQAFLADTSNYGVVLGYAWNRWTLEGIINLNETENNNTGGDQIVGMYHLYGVYRTEGRHYLKAKAGITNERYSIKNGEGEEVMNDVHSGIARGIGFGFRTNVASVELEYSWLGGSLELINLGLKYHF